MTLLNAGLHPDTVNVHLGISRTEAHWQGRSARSSFFCCLTGLTGWFPLVIKKLLANVAACRQSGLPGMLSLSFWRYHLLKLRALFFVNHHACSELER